MREDQAFKEINNPWDMIAYLFRYRMKELLALVVLLLLGYIAVANISYSPQDGFSWTPSVSVEIKK
jgi:hypothetical protein